MAHRNRRHRAGGQQIMACWEGVLPLGRLRGLRLSWALQALIWSLASRVAPIVLQAGQQGGAVATGALEADQAGVFRRLAASSSPRPSNQIARGLTT